MPRTRIGQKTDELLQGQGIANPDIRRLITWHILVLLGGAVLYAGLGSGRHFLAYAVGGLLSFLNFYLLGRMVPHLVWEQKGGTFALLLSFYLRLLATGVILFVAIAWLKLPVLSLLIGLSTVLFNILIWLGKFVLTHKHKEA